MNQYTSALKNKRFTLIYIDAFAGSGKVQIRPDDDLDNTFRKLLDGSVIRAIQTTDKPFDELVFIEKERENYDDLERIRAKCEGRDIVVHNGEANEFLMNLERDWQRTRDILFLDPYGTQVKFETICRIAQFRALYMWILMPVSAIARLLPRGKEPDEISKQRNSQLLNEIYGDESWRELYHDSPQLDLYKQNPDRVRDRGVQGLISIYKKKLREVFGDRFLDLSLELKNSIMYELMFCCGSPNSRAINVSHKIARHLIKKMSVND